MIEASAVPGLFVALTLPWLCGSIWLRWLLRRTGRCNAFIVLGHGYILGTFLITLAIRLWDAVGFNLNFWGIAAVVAGIAVIGVLLQTLRTQLADDIPGATEPVPNWHVAVALLLLALIAWRYVTLLQELLLRPLYAWDAWMNWVPKAVVWFHHGRVLDFISPEAWLQYRGHEAYTLGNRQAVFYPITVPLIQLWGMLAVGTWDDSTIYLPWLMAPLALGLALFGHLRLAGVPFLLAVIACYLLLSLPYLNVHTVLAGYADIWVASAFGLAVCALHEWRQTRHWAYAVLVLVLALLCGLLKQPALVLAAILLVCVARVWFDLKPKVELALLAVVVVVVVLPLVFGVTADVPHLGHINLKGGVVELGRFGKLELEIHDVSVPFLRTFFVMINWNLLWYLLLPYAIYRMFRGGLMNIPTDEVLAVLGAFAFVAVIFVFSKYYVVALNYVTMNRALLYPIPAMIFCIFLGYRRRVNR
jgi:hypothetical protein